MWRNIQINDKTYMIRVIKETDRWTILLTDLTHLQIETLTKAVIINRCQQLNPLLNTDAFDCTETISNMLDDIPKHVEQTSESQIKLRGDVEGCTIKFTLSFTQTTPQQFWEYVTRPLCLSSQELMRRHKILLDLVKKKDEEIAEYKAEGAELIRSMHILILKTVESMKENIETKPFDESLFNVRPSLSETSDFTSAFQEMIGFYNTLNPCNLHTKTEQPSNQISSSAGLEPQESTTNISNTEDSNHLTNTESNRRKSKQREQPKSDFKLKIKEEISIKKCNKKPKTLNDVIS